MTYLKNNDLQLYFSNRLRLIRMPAKGPRHHVAMTIDRPNTDLADTVDQAQAMPDKRAVAPFLDACGA
jgi:hypothetical protein